MQITIDIPETLAHKAEVAGVDVSTYLQRLIERDVLSESAGGTRLVRFEPGSKTPAEAGADILEMRKKLTLDGIKIKDLIEEGRRY
ncbi:hypothetical protein EDE15_2306 [Edaphobacter aggregans]|jgi:hypothetical protein|uniref:Uncharacterized protein n=1 Tax=Edaphobacter aggregans TaxID=570835 RepID=A0A3R9Q9X4_9BACT|nr:hypothetical protein [Edaphobacter aggregans]RSL16781.1 hypothetical protein EDE15_2306 [Edaphobacter aggregans]